jgi:hypothetical protein
VVNDSLYRPFYHHALLFIPARWLMKLLDAEELLFLSGVVVFCFLSGGIFVAVIELLI